MNIPTYMWHDETIGGTPHSFTPPDAIQPGDLVQFLHASRNSAPGTKPTGGAPWHTLFRIDTSTDEFHCWWWKFAGGETENWELTLAGTGASMVIVTRFKDPLGGRPRYIGGVNQVTLDPMFVPRGGAYFGSYIGSYQTANARYGGPWRIGHAAQGSDERISPVLAVEGDGRTVGPYVDESGGADADQYCGSYGVVYPPAARGVDSIVR